MNELRLFLEPQLRASAEAGAHNFINLIANVAQNARFRVTYHDLPLIDLPGGTYSLTHMAAPAESRGLVFRRSYFYPFWQIDQSAARWDWDVARAPFDPAGADPDAQRFFGYWQHRLFAEAAQQTDRAGFIYVPLQGRLRDHRSFQRCSPLEMLEHCLSQAPDKQIIAGLHPKETYSAGDLTALDRLVQRHERLHLVTGEMVRHLQGCDYVVTQNSSVAFAGFLFRKPALLFAEIDFHHIAIRADLAKLSAAFDQIARHDPPYATYVHWFLQLQSINAGRPDAAEKIAARLRRFGWPI